jgi:hypothetical protein
VHDGRAYPLFRPRTHTEPFGKSKRPPRAMSGIPGTQMKVQISNYTIPNSMGSQGI